MSSHWKPMRLISVLPAPRTVGIAPVAFHKPANLVGSTMKGWYWREFRLPFATDSTNLLYDIASLTADFHDSITALSDPEEKYDQILKYDSRIRAFDTKSTPHLIFTSNPKAPGPHWVRWAKGVASIVQAHKTIMIHRSFQGKSFTDLQYTYTRSASIAAAKTVIREADVATADVERSAFWHLQVRSQYGNLRTYSQVGVVLLGFVNDFGRPILLVQV